MNKPILPTMQLRDLLASQTPRRANIHFDGINFPVAFTPAANPTEKLLISFHGGVNREARVVPVFVPANAGLQLNWHQLSISDPLLDIYDDLTISWYCGDVNLNVQDSLTSLFREVAQHLDCKKRVYSGGSGGGFAALFHSAHDLGSIAIALNPQVIITNYYERIVRIYLSKCWPEIESISDINDNRVFDLTDIYRTPPGNTVIYIQNTADKHHLFKHCAPFLSAISSRKDIYGPIDFIAHTSFWGKIGHHITPSNLYLGWLEAIAAAEDTSGDAILHARTEQINAAKVSVPVQGQAATAKAFATEDIALADAISKWSVS